MMLSHSNYFFSINCKNVKKQQIGSFVMFKNKQSDGNSNAITGQIGANIRITGKIEAEDALGFGGEIEGDISAGELTVMHTAKINGQITANSAIISGTVIGDITADRLVILSSAKVKGSLYYTTIQIETGAQVEGQFHQKEASAFADITDIKEDE